MEKVALICAVYDVSGTTDKLTDYAIFLSNGNPYPDEDNLYEEFPVTTQNNKHLVHDSIIKKMAELQNLGYEIRFLF